MMDNSDLSDLASRIRQLKSSPLADLINKKLLEFSKPRNENELFNELCFCLMTANCSAERGLLAEKEISDGFSTLPREELRRKIRQTVCRFYNIKTEYVLSARAKKPELTELIKTTDGKKAREWLVKNIKGIGYKEASHFLRNVGYTDVAIIDFHILDLLEREGVHRPKNLGKRAYLEIEKELEELSKKTKTNLAELDLYLWYLETGKVLK